MDRENKHFDFVPPVSSADKEKYNPVGALLVNTGALVVYFAEYSAGKCLRALAVSTKSTRKAIKPVLKGIGHAVAGFFTGIGHGFSETAKSLSVSCRTFAERVKSEGFAKAVKLQLSDMASAVKKSGSFFKAAVNYAVPVFSIALLVGVVYNTASRSYGIAVECNGKELGVVAAESVVTDAQQAIADKSVYYDTANEIYITANLSIKPLNAYDEVIDENTLARKMEEQISDSLPESAKIDENAVMPVNAPADDVAEQNDESAAINSAADAIEGKVRAFAVTVDGEIIGAVESTEKLADFLDDEKSKYLAEDVVSVDFDKDVSFEYEEYVDPDKLISQDEVISELTKIVSEPVYYEVQKGDSPWNIARDNDMTVDELKNCDVTFGDKHISDITQDCPVGAVIQLSEEVPYLRTQITKNVTYTETIDYEIIKNEDENLYKGETAVDVKGVEGEAEVTALVTYEGDRIISTEVLERKVISEPVNKVMRVGTRKTSTEVSTGSGGSGEYFWPVDGGKISDYFGGYRNHKGLDIAAPYGTKIFAAESGTVTRAGNKYDGYGNCVMIANNDGNVTVYGHMSSIAISYGEYVVKGQLIGYVGSTGDSTGNHLHFEVRSNGYYNNPLDYISQY